MCDGLGVPLQDSQRKLVFLELKASGSYADAAPQLRAGVQVVLSLGIPRSVALTAEIWHSKRPKATLAISKRMVVNGRPIFVRHRRSI